jgi:hypothetical protein
VLVEGGNEMFPGLRSGGNYTRTPECSAGRAAFACVREIYMLRPRRDLFFRLSYLLRDPLVLRTQLRIVLEMLGQ